MPPMPSSPDGDGFIDLISDHKPPVKDEEKVEKFVKKEMVVEESEDRRKNKVEAIGEKSELPKLDLEKLTQDSGSVRSIRLQQQQQAKASIPKVEKTEKTGKPTLHSFLCPILIDRKSTRLNSSHNVASRMPSSA